MRTAAFVGLGSNLEEPLSQLRRAVMALGAIPDSRLQAISPAYRSDPVGGPPGQPDFINAVALLDTGLEAHALLDALQDIEHAQQRVRDVRWGPRTLDLDLLVFGEQMIADARLNVPHPRMHQRAFVLYPLADIAPGLCIPGHGLVRDLLRTCPYAGLDRLEAGIISEQQGTRVGQVEAWVQGFLDRREVSAAVAVRHS